MHFKPFTEDIIFYDTEFSSLDPYEGELLSVGMVKMSGEEFYCELVYEGEYSDWVKEHLLHTLTAPKLSREEAKKCIADFVGDTQPYMMAYANQYDAIYTYKLFKGPETPFFWLPLDFASVLFALGYDPEAYMKDDYTRLAKELGVSTAQRHTHNALDDATFLREIYLALIDIKN